MHKRVPQRSSNSSSSLARNYCSSPLRATVHPQQPEKPRTCRHTRHRHYHCPALPPTAGDPSSCRVIPAPGKAPVTPESCQRALGRTSARENNPISQCSEGKALEKCNKGTAQVGQSCPRQTNPLEIATGRVKPAPCSSRAAGMRSQTPKPRSEQRCPGGRSQHWSHPNPITSAPAPETVGKSPH